MKVINRQGGGDVAQVCVTTECRMVRWQGESAVIHPLAGRRHLRG